MTPTRLGRALALALLAAGCAPPEPAEERLALEPAAYDELDGWAADDHAAALALFLGSCDHWAKRAAGDAIGRATAFGTAGDWA
ncbi:MAG: murein transglycosylase, partial [Alphaproteobacteria bacterium]